MTRQSGKGRQGGFTIMELLISMSIAVILVGIGAGLAFGTLSTEKKMKQVSGKVESAVRRASMVSTMERRDVFLKLYQNSVVSADGDIDLDDATLTMNRPGIFSRWVSPPSRGYSWKFDSKGLSEPVEIKLSFAEGEMTMQFDPLTGGVKDRTLMIFE